MQSARASERLTSPPLSTAHRRADIVEAMSELIILTASATLMGPDVREHLFERVSRLYTTLDEGITPLSVLSKFGVLCQLDTECSVTSVLQVS